MSAREEIITIKSNTVYNNNIIAKSLLDDTFIINSDTAILQKYLVESISPMQWRSPYPLIDVIINAG